MAKYRIRYVSKNGTSPWMYTQEIVGHQVSKPEVRAAAIEIPTSVETNQFGRFRYGEKQYGRLIKAASGSLEFDKTPMRIRFSNGSYIYTQNVSKQGVTRGVRARSIINNKPSEWTYSQSEEV